MHRFARIALVGLLAWQGVAAALLQARRTAANAPGDVLASLTATTADRVRRALGDDAAIVTALRDVVPRGTVVLNRQVHGSLEELRRTAVDERQLIAALERLSARNGLFVQLTALTFPAPCLLSVPDPVAVVEREHAAGRDRWLFVLADDPEPEGRPGWTRVHRDRRFSLWRFRTGS